MSHVYLQVSTHANGDTHGFDAGVRALSNFKGIQVSDTVHAEFASLAVAPGRKATHKEIARSDDGQVCIVDIGTWLPLPAQPGKNAAWLIEQYRSLGVREMARRLQGIFALVIIDQARKQVHVISDRCGSLHIFHRRSADGHAVCTSSAVLAAGGDSKLDPLGVHEFIATGIIYEERSLWSDVKKIAPATIVSFENGGASFQRYWDFAETKAESLGLGQSIDAVHNALVEVLKALPEQEQPLVSDLTGGYDSRFLLAGLLKAGRPFDTTVSGAADHPDVVVAAQIAKALGLQHGHITPAALPNAEEFDAALRMTDGEYDAFDYARILRTHRQLSAKHGMSLNGSFGELARGYWWELLWPKLASHESLDAGMISRKRFAAIYYDKSIFSDAAKLDLSAHMSEVAQRAIQMLPDFPNTTQMDCVYFTLRMQRWQGRIASSTNQLWPSFSPIGFAQVLDPILAAKADTRFRSLLVRALFARFEPTLARIPLEHGYPPMPANPLNLWRFTPLLDHYGGKVVGKVSARLGLGRGRNTPSAASNVRPELDQLLEESGIRAWIAQPKLLETGLFQQAQLTALLQSGARASGATLDQWRRLVTVEALLRKIY